MHSKKPCNQTQYIDHFSISEKIFGRLAYGGLYIIAVIALTTVSWSLGLIYTIYVLLTSFLIARKFFCPTCPYPKAYNTCLLLPVWIVKPKHQKKNNAPIL